MSRAGKGPLQTPSRRCCFSPLPRRAGRAQQGRGPACLALQEVAGRGHGAAVAWPCCPQRPSPQQEAGCPPAPARRAAPQHGSRCPAVPGVPGLTQSLLLPWPSFTLRSPKPVLGPGAGSGCAGRAYALGGPAGDISPQHTRSSLPPCLQAVPSQRAAWRGLLPASSQLRAGPTLAQVPGAGLCIPSPDVGSASP